MICESAEGVNVVHPSAPRLTAKRSRFSSRSKAARRTTD
jgi:hypothetical protein